MPSYLITGASRGLGYEFLRQFSEDPSAVVVGLVRNKEAAEEKATAELKRDNVHFVQADMSDFESIKRAVQSTSEITGGSLDYLIANAAHLSDESIWYSLEKLAEDRKILEAELQTSFNVNVLGNIHLLNLAVPLVLKGEVKKVIAISTGLADNDLTRDYEFDHGLPYCVSKAAMNTVMAKYSAKYGRQGVLFLSICPGVVATSEVTLGADDFDNGDGEDDISKLKMEIGAKFMKYAPGWKGPATPAVSVDAIRTVIEKASVEAGDGGTFVSHLGTKKWL